MKSPALLPWLGSLSLPCPDTKTMFISVNSIINTTRHPQPTRRYTFSLESDQEKVTWYVTLRPGLKEFLHAAKEAGFQIVTFSRAKCHVLQILHLIDPNREMITHRIYHGYSSPDIDIDLNLTGRMMDRSVIIDHDSRLNVKPWCNMIRLSSFTGNADDRELWRMIRFFIVQRDFVDVRHLLHVCSETHAAPPLPDLPLPPTTRKTLFLDMDETLMTHVPLADKEPDHYDFATDMCYVIKRPGVDKLLRMATDHDYEIVVFTAGCREYASPIIYKLDPDGLIAHRLYRDSCKRSKHGQPIKDLSSTGRSLDRCLIVDDIWQRVPQTKNAIRIRPFKGDMQDSELRKLLLYFSIEGKYENLQDAVSYMNNMWLGPVVCVK